MTSKIDELLKAEAYTPEELATLLAIDVEIVRQAAFAGALPAMILDHHIIEIRREDALCWLATRGQQSIEEPTKFGSMRAMNSKIMKSPITRILVPFDGSEFAKVVLPHAARFAGPGVEFTFMQVIPPGEKIYGLFGDELLSAQGAERACEAGVRKDLESLREYWLPKMQHVVISVPSGGYADKILSTAEKLKADLIVMATHGRGAVGRLLVGSVADRVVRTSSVPVMLVRPYGNVSEGMSDQLIRRLIVPLDGSELAALALPVAARIAEQLKVSLVLVTVTELPIELPVFGAYGAAFSQKTYEELLAEGRAQAERMLQESGATLDGLGITVNRQLAEGRVVPGILGVAKPGDVIVMTSHGRGGLQRMLLGSVANRLISEADVPVIVVPARPEMCVPNTERSA